MGGKEALLCSRVPATNHLIARRKLTATLASLLFTQPPQPIAVLTRMEGVVLVPSTDATASESVPSTVIQSSEAAPDFQARLLMATAQTVVVGQQWRTGAPSFLSVVG